MQVTSIFFYFHNVFNPIKDKIHHISFILSAATAFNLDQSRILSFGKKLTSRQFLTLDERMIAFVYIIPSNLRKNLQFIEIDPCSLRE